MKIVVNGTTVELPGYRLERQTIESAIIPISLSPASSTDLCYAEKILTSYGKKIAAIKSYRERIGCGLKDAKDAVDVWDASIQGREYFSGASEQRHRLQSY